MDRSVIPNRHFLSYLTSIDDPRQLRKVIKAAPDNEIKALLEVIGNLKKGNFSFRIKELEKLNDKEDYLDSIFEDLESIKEKRDSLAKHIETVEQILITATPFIRELQHR